MGPQHTRCGKRRRPPRGLGARPASMGPQHTRCGKHGNDKAHAAPAGRFNGAATYSLRKAGGTSRTRRGGPQLQWGRNILVAESPGRVRARDSRLWASMGPQHTRCGKSAPLESPWLVGSLQWGRNILVAERTHVTVLLLTGWHASMGPQHTRCGKQGLMLLVRCFAMLQWGRNILVAESRRISVSECCEK